MTPLTSDVIVVGGGIMGSSATFFLRRRGRSVTLLESGLVGQQASGTNFGNTRRQGRPLYQLPLANRSSEIWRRAHELLGCDIEYLQSGHVRVCYRDRPEIVGVFEDYANGAREAGLELEVLSGGAMRRRFPFFGPDVLAASYSPNDGHANPRLVSPAFARAASREGAAVFENTEIVHVGKDGGDFRVCSVDGREFRAPALLITAGAWANTLTSQFGEPVPLSSHGPTMSVTEPVPYAILPSVGVYTPVTVESVYVRQIPRGNLIIGGSTPGPTFPDIRRAHVKPGNTLTQLREIRRLVPRVSGLNIIRVWTGIEAYLPDSQPVMGHSERVSGLFFAFGFSGAGFQLGPGVGDTMAELIDTGRTDISLAPYRCNRFQHPEVSI